MKKAGFFLILGCLVVCLAGCASFFGRTPSPRSITSYSGLKARIAVGDFESEALKANPAITTGLREIFIAALEESNHFYLLERQVNGEDKVKAPELIISASILEFEPQTSGGKAGIGSGGGVGNGMLGGMLGSSLNRASLVLAIHIIDAATAKAITETKKIKGQASDLSGINEGALGSLRLNKNLSGFMHTPVDKAIRICMLEATHYIIETIPQDYYKY